MIRRPHTFGQSGFTLLEVLMAVAILSLIGLATLKVTSAAAVMSVRMEGSAMAHIVAENALVDVLSGAVPMVRGRQVLRADNMNQRWQVTRQISATQDARILQVTIDAQADGDGQAASASITGYKILRADGAP